MRRGWVLNQLGERGVRHAVRRKAHVKDVSSSKSAPRLHSMAAFSSTLHTFSSLNILSTPSRRPCNDIRLCAPRLSLTSINASPTALRQPPPNGRRSSWHTYSGFVPGDEHAPGALFGVCTCEASIRHQTASTGARHHALRNDRPRRCDLAPPLCHGPHEHDGARVPRDPGMGFTQPTPMHRQQLQLRTTICLFCYG